MKMNVFSVFILILAIVSTALVSAIDRNHLYSKEPISRVADLKVLSTSQADAFLKEATRNLFINDFGVACEFIHKPYGTHTQVHYKCLLFGIQRGSSIYKRLVFLGENQEILSDFIFHSGKESSAWKFCLETSQFEKLNLAEINQPMVDTILFRPIDIMMPYLQWEKYKYLGPDSMGLNSSVQKFRFIKTDEDKIGMPTSDGIEIAVDARFKAIREIRYLNEGLVEKKLSTAGFKKINRTWFISRLVFKNLERRESTVLKIMDRLEGFEDLTESFFNPMESEVFDLKAMQLNPML